MTGRKTDRRRLSDEDAALWRHVTRSVKPLAKRSRRPASEASEVAEEVGTDREPEAPASRPRPPFVLSPPPPAAPPGLPELAHGESPGLDRRTAGRLKKGRMPVEGRIDLHGHSQAKAHRALNAFLLAGYESGRRCVLVITGKGLRAQSGAGVLREAVPRWLNQVPLRDKVLSFTYATPRDGGEGALYVLLKRKRA